MAKRDYYDVLGVNRDAKIAQIKSAYRKLARKFHPDVNKEPDAEEKFKEATEAYAVLSDSEKRKLYDRFGHAGVSGAGPGGPGGRRPGGPGGGFSVNIEDLFGGGGGFMGMSLEEILASLGERHGGARPGARRPAARRGADMEYPARLEFLQAVHGTTISLRLQSPDAKGPEETLHIKIPPGIADGGKVRVRGKGHPGRGGARGDLYIVVRVGPHPYFRRQGNDIHVTVPVSITEAVLGAKVDVPTLDGTMTVKIPPGTGSSRRLRLRGKGVGGRDGTSRGDQYVEIRIVPPPAVSDAGRKLLEEFQATEEFDPREGAPWN